MISHFCQIVNNCYWNVDRLFQDGKKVAKGCLKLVIKRWDSVYTFSHLSDHSFIFLWKSSIIDKNGGSTLANLIPDYWLCFSFIDLSTLENVIMISWYQTTTNITPNSQLQKLFYWKQKLSVICKKITIFPLVKGASKISIWWSYTE